MDTGVPLTPDILGRLQNTSQPLPAKRYSDSTQFLLFLVVVTALLLSAFPLLIMQTNKNFTPKTIPTPTPDSSLLFYINKDK